MSESWFVDGGWECHCGPVPPYPSCYPGPCRQCFALAPLSKRPTAPSPRETLLTPEMAAVIEAAKAFVQTPRLVSEAALKDAVAALRALEGDA